MSRVIAVCQEGPLDGECVSVALSADGGPEPLYSRGDVLGTLYVPCEPVELTEQLTAQFRQETRHGDVLEVLEIQHDGAFAYREASPAERERLMAAFKARHEDAAAGEA